MRILVVGGGPAGLYAGLLIAKSRPDARVTLVERNAADATYGWGVVFSDRTLAEFREADLRTYEAITERFVTWEAIDVFCRDELVRSGGHVFAGIARVELLRILQKRARELGVELRFEVELQDLERAPEYDLVVGADGVNSLVRTTHEKAFGPRFRAGRSRYIWFGTTRVLDSFTFVFRENEHGLFQTHAYPFDGVTSTWIVEAHEATWRRAGLDAASEEESIRYCEKLFAPELRGHPLLSNRSQWIAFLTLRNRTWRHRNIVLLGDAAHTAHFSIGSGTKLAMEDAISLARALDRRDGDVAPALGDYETERKPVVERFQEAAEESRSYFERTSRYLHLEPPQFAFHLLTRSGRIDYDELRRRDVAYVDGFDRWFAARSGASIRAPLAPPPVFAPLRLGARRLENRVVRRGPLGGTSDPGAALVIAGIAAVSPEGRITAEEAGVYADEDLERWRSAVLEVHERKASFALELGHAGRRGATRPRAEGLDRPLTDGWELLAPSPIRYGRKSATPREMTPDDLDDAREAFAAGAARAAAVGVDLLLVHMGHGYLLASFLSPLTNRRSDGFGGSLEERMRFPLEAFEAVRAAWPEDRALGVVLQASDWARGGLEIGEAVKIAGALKERGCDVVLPVAGQAVPESRPRYGPAYLAPYAERIRTEARIATIAAGRVTTSGRANTIVGGGRADLVVIS